MEVILLRHAIAQEHHPLGDAERALTSEGIHKLRQVLKLLRRCGPRPQLILSSPLVRARETAQIAGRLLGCPVTIEPGLAPLGQLSGLGTARVMLVGHEPDLSLWAARQMNLCQPVFRLKKAGLAYLAGPPGQVQLQWLLSPRWADSTHSH